MTARAMERKPARDILGFFFSSQLLHHRPLDCFPLMTPLCSIDEVNFALTEIMPLICTINTFFAAQCGFFLSGVRLQQQPRPLRKSFQEIRFSSREISKSLQNEPAPVHRASKVGQPRAAKTAPGSRHAGQHISVSQPDPNGFFAGKTHQVRNLSKVVAWPNT